MQNASTTEWKGASYLQFVRHVYPQERSMFDVESYAFRGPAFYDGEKYQKLDVEDTDDLAIRKSFTNGWVAEMQHHFVAAAVPPKGEAYDFSLQKDQGHSLISYRGPLKLVPAGSSASFTEKLFVGPKLQDQLRRSVRSSSSPSTTASSRSSPTRCSGCCARCTSSSRTGASRSSS